MQGENEKGEIEITLAEAEALMGPALRDSNGFEECYMLPLDAGTTRVFRTPDDFILVRVPLGASPTAQFGTEFLFDGIGWSDETLYRYGTPAWDAVVIERGAGPLVPYLQAFLASLPVNKRREAEEETRVCWKSFQVMATDERVKKRLMDAGKDELIVGMHSSPFITLSLREKPDPEDRPTVIVGPPFMLKDAREKNPGLDDVALARIMLTEALQG